MKLEGRIVLVTGAGSGIGRAIAGLFCEKGARVIISDVNRAAAEAR
jgi:NAD(P)-dependent dehydrogenase (short-subunit alcohol dehydrogenase family)